jgi:hypothetical protein
VTLTTSASREWPEEERISSPMTKYQLKVARATMAIRVSRLSLSRRIGSTGARGKRRRPTKANG